ncbi:biotin--[acetyl-CoA-carboxylase] ligase [bacterium]|nr:biotin--[acetyl-CoA-carboxylase] ligase [bacterium]
MGRVSQMERGLDECSELDRFRYRTALHVDYVRLALHGELFGQWIEYTPSLPSTMPAAHQLVQTAKENGNACAGAVIVADEQTAGRGRLARQWNAPPGRGLLTSIVIAPPVLPVDPTQLPMIAGVAVLEALRVTVPVLARQFRLKWPNDVIILGDGALGKVAGMLIESVMGESGSAYAVLGIGVNVNQRPEELPTPRVNGLQPVSLYRLLHHDVSREELLIVLCRTLGRLLDPAYPLSPEEIHRRWESALVNIGQEVTVTGGAVTSPIAGIVVGTTRNGSLIVEAANGVQHFIDAGDAEFRWAQR